MSDLVVFGRNRADMLTAQNSMIEWASGALTESQAHLAEIVQNLELANANGWPVAGWETERRRAQKKVEYYEKIHGALAAGYVIVPNIPVDVFAIRTKRTYPVQQYVESTNEFDVRGDRTQRGQALAIGSGEYHDSEPFQRAGEHKTSEGKTIYVQWADKFNPVDFPIKAVMPVILEETSKALALKIFDEVGINPGRPGWSPSRVPNVRGVDPMVIGRVVYKQPDRRRNGGKIVSFLITWWLKPSDILV